MIKPYQRYWWTTSSFEMFQDLFGHIMSYPKESDI